MGARLKAVPWLMLLQTAMVLDRRRRALSREERSRLAHLLRESRGRPGNLTEVERAELRVIATKLDLVGIGRELMPLARRGGNGGSRKAP